jgi:hypothetical protein
MKMRHIKLSMMLNSEHLPGNNIIATGVLQAVVLAILPLLICSCGQGQAGLLRPDGSARTGQPSKEEFREALNNFEEFAAAAIAQSASQLDQLQPDFKTKKMSMVQRTQLRYAYHTMLKKENPIEAFIETWALSVRVTNYLKEGEGSNLFGKHQDIAIAAFEKIDTEIERIGGRFLKKDTFTKTQKKINDFAHANPITGIFSNTILYVTEVESGKPGLFDDVVGIPMAPFKAIGGVDRTASAIYGLRDSAHRVSDVIEELPESARWQLLLLLMEMKETELVKSILTSMSRFSDSSVRFAETAEKLPEQLREQTSILIEEIDSRQNNLQTTLDKAEKTAATVERSIAKADEVSDSFGRTANSVKEAATAWDKAAKATNLAIKEFGGMKPVRKDPNSKSSFNINDYQDTAEAVTMTANELRTLLTEIREFIKSDDLPTYTLTGKKLTNYLIVRLALLFVFVFVLALVYRIVVVRIVYTRRQIYR